MRGAIRVHSLCISKKERNRESMCVCVSSWESYISPTTSVGINPGQFILLNLFRLAQIVTVSRLEIKLPRKAVAGLSTWSYSVWSFRPGKIDDSWRDFAFINEKNLFPVVGGARAVESVADKRKNTRIAALWKVWRLYEFKRDEIILFIFILHLLLHLVLGGTIGDLSDN